jgi:hypothetical protein
MASGLTVVVRARDPAIPLSAVRTFVARIGPAAFQERIASMLLGVNAADLSSPCASRRESGGPGRNKL